MAGETLVCEVCEEEFTRKGTRGPIPFACGARCRGTAFRRRQGMAERFVYEDEAERRLADRLGQRRRRGYQGKVTRPIADAPRETRGPSLDPAPFLVWLDGRREAHETDHELAARFGLDGSQLRRLRAGEQGVTLDVVDRALLKSPTGLWELYPDLPTTV